MLCPACLGLIAARDNSLWSNSMHLNPLSICRLLFACSKCNVFFTEKTNKADVHISWPTLIRPPLDWRWPFYAPGWIWEEDVLLRATFDPLSNTSGWGRSLRLISFTAVSASAYLNCLVLIFEETTCPTVQQFCWGVCVIVNIYFAFNFQNKSQQLRISSSKALRPTSPIGLIFPAPMPLSHSDVVHVAQ